MGILKVQLIFLFLFEREQGYPGFMFEIWYHWYDSDRFEVESILDISPVYFDMCELDLLELNDFSLI